MLLLVYAYLFWLAGQRVNYALVHVENKFDVARTLGGALMCLTVPLATYQVRIRVVGFSSVVLSLLPLPWWWSWWWWVCVTDARSFVGLFFFVDMYCAVLCCTYGNLFLLIALLLRA